jgi:hypothetical protein
MIYLVGYGWIWVSGWSREGEEPLIKLLAEDMTDEQAKRFCAPKVRRGGRQTTPNRPHQNGSKAPDSGTDKIPF